MLWPVLLTGSILQRSKVLSVELKGLLVMVICYRRGPTLFQVYPVFLEFLLDVQCRCRLLRTATLLRAGPDPETRCIDHIAKFSCNHTTI